MVAALNDLALGQRELKEALTQKNMCHSSSIPTAIRQKHFKTYEDPISTLFDGPCDTSTEIIHGVRVYADALLLHHTDNNLGEVAHVQPPTTVLLQCLAGRLKRTLPACDISNEWSYTFRVEDEDGTGSVSGKGDRALL
jgi:hypothetical protein